MSRLSQHITSKVKSLLSLNQKSNSYQDFTPEKIKLHHGMDGMFQYMEAFNIWGTT